MNHPRLSHWVVNLDTSHISNYVYVTLCGLTNKTYKTSRSSGGRIKPKYSPNFRFPQSQLVSMATRLRSALLFSTAKNLRYNTGVEWRRNQGSSQHHGRSYSYVTNTHTMLCHGSGLEKPCRHAPATQTKSKKVVCNLLVIYTCNAIYIYIALQLSIYKSTNTRQMACKMAWRAIVYNIVSGCVYMGI